LRDTGEDKWRRELWVPALGIWTTLAERKFFLVLVPPDVSIPKLVVAIFRQKNRHPELPVPASAAALLRRVHRSLGPLPRSR